MGLQRVRHDWVNFTSLVVRWLRIHLPVQGAWVWSLVRKLRSCVPQGTVLKRNGGILTQAPSGDHPSLKIAPDCFPFPCSSWLPWKFRFKDKVLCAAIFKVSVLLLWKDTVGIWIPSSGSVCPEDRICLGWTHEDDMRLDHHPDAESL